MISAPCTCAFCTGEKKRDDNWCARCGAVQMQPPKSWENLDVCERCEIAMACDQRDQQIMPANSPVNGISFVLGQSEPVSDELSITRAQLHAALAMISWLVADIRQVGGYMRQEHQDRLRQAELLLLDHGWPR